jgi:hypothetical protein
VKKAARNWPPNAWVTREGEVILFKKMSDSHLQNTIAFLERKRPIKILQTEPTYRGLYKEATRRPSTKAWLVIRERDRLRIITLEI